MRNSTQTLAQLNFIAFFYFIANFVASAIHYFFQLRAAQVLTDHQYGEFSVWLSGVSLVLSLSIFAQNIGNFLPLSIAKSRAVIWFATSLCALLFIAIIYNNITSDFLLGFLAIIFAIPFAWFVGQLQVRHMFLSMSFLLVLVAIVKFGATWMPALEPLRNFYLALPVSFLGGLLACSILLFFPVSNFLYTEQNRDSITKRLLASFLLAIFALGVPNIDTLWVGQTQQAYDVAVFAKIILVCKAVFFSLMIFANWILPKQISGKSIFKLNKKRLWQFFCLCFIAASGVYLTMPWIFLHIFSINLGIHQDWLFVSTFNISLMAGLYLLAQGDCAQLRMRRPLIWFVLYVCIYFIAKFTGLNVMQYLLLSGLFHSLLLIYWFRRT
ncbi:MAG: hypothetical protein A2Z20_03700 [Bdellovibrionales bacterium RBG_16_40_8]|nr:MAG: hypothetical protein A2Z20_03700 [Bdellovibrionales bacterium RBG_16_40_8]